MNDAVLAKTPATPYYAVIFTSIKDPVSEGYAEMAAEMDRLAREQEGFLGVDSARETVGITVSYWANLEAIKNWKANTRHLTAQQKGRDEWYINYKVRICLVERDYEF